MIKPFDCLFVLLTLCYLLQFPVPDPQIFIATPVGTSFFSGVAYSLICDVTLVRDIDTRINVDIVWDQNGSAVIDSDRRNIGEIAAVNAVTYRSSLTFEALGGSSDGGQYNCTVTVTAAERGEFVGNQTAATSHTFSVEGKSEIRWEAHFSGQIEALM